MEIPSGLTYLRYIFCACLFFTLIVGCATTTRGPAVPVQSTYASTVAGFHTDIRILPDGEIQPITNLMAET